MDDLVHFASIKRVNSVFNPSTALNFNGMRKGLIKTAKFHLGMELLAVACCFSKNTIPYLYVSKLPYTLVPCATRKSLDNIYRF